MPCKFETCLSVSNNLCGKLFSSVVLPIIFDDSLRVTFSPFCAADFTNFLSSCELITLRLHCHIDSFYTDIVLNQDKIAMFSLQYSHSFFRKI